LALRVNRTSKTWVLIGRFGSRNATRRKLGEYPAMSLREARAEAMRWRALLAQGKDPAVPRVKRVTRFGDIAEAFIADAKRRGLRQIHKDANELTRELRSWWDRPIDAIDRMDVLHVIDAVTARSLWQAHHVFSNMSRLFNWAVERGTVDRSPCHGLRPSKLIGPKVPRDRILTDHELRALWHLCPQLGYPIGPLIRVLMLTGQRRSEVAGMRWSEIHNGAWTIPRERMKMKTAHVVPLVPEVRALLEELPRFSGDYVFTTTHGRLPVNGFSKAKKRIDALMRAPPWTLHDLRRTMRTHLSALPVPDLVRELVIGHMLSVVVTDTGREVVANIASGLVSR
jgi:integrase